MPESSETIHLSGRLTWLDHKHIHRLVLPLRRRLVIHSVVWLLVFLAISAFRPQAPIAFAVFVVIYCVMLLLAMSLVITLVGSVVPFNVANGHGSRYVVLFRVQSALMTAVCCLAAWGVRRFAAWLRLPLQVLAALCLPLFPLGTVLGVRILYLLATGPEPRLLTSGYEQIVRIAGPMKIQNSSRIRLFTWVVLALVVLIIVLVGLISLIPEEFRHNL